jgi:hypothetical protein
MLERRASSSDFRLSSDIIGLSRAKHKEISRAKLPKGQICRLGPWFRRHKILYIPNGLSVRVRLNVRLCF